MKGTRGAIGISHRAGTNALHTQAEQFFPFAMDMRRSTRLSLPVGELSRGKNRGERMKSQSGH